MWLLTTSLIKAKPDSQDLFFSSLTWETEFMGLRKEESAGAAALNPAQHDTESLWSTKIWNKHNQADPGREQKGENDENPPEVTSVGLNSR